MKSIAVSFAYITRKDATEPARILLACTQACDVLSAIVKTWPAIASQPEVFNVNIPLSLEPCSKVVLTKFHRGGYSSLFKMGLEPAQFVFSPTFHVEDVEHGSDLWAIKNNFISVTPMNAAFHIGDPDLAGIEEKLLVHLK